jgi:ribosomal protein S18 acetylase RimI-like enzyme
VVSESPPNVAIEAADRDDIAILVDLWIDLAADQRSYGSHLVPTENRSAIHEAMSQHVMTDSALVAKRSGEVVGFITFDVESGRYRQDVSRGVVHNIYVRDDDRNEGIGYALLAAAEAELETLGVDIVSLQAMASNDRARRFYREHGYTPHRIELEKPINGDTEE